MIHNAFAFFLGRGVSYSTGTKVHISCLLSLGILSSILEVCGNMGFGRETKNEQCLHEEIVLKSQDLCMHYRRTGRRAFPQV